MARGQILGWLVSVFELLIATPIWMAAHLHPEGEGVAGQHAASGYKVVLEILLRPTLLIFGLLASMLILTPFMQFFSTTFFNAMSTITSEGISGATTFVFVFIVYGSLCWMVINMVLNAITIVPNGIMRVIGGMEGTNMHLGKEMSSNVKSGLMIGATKAIDAAQAGRRHSAMNPNKGGKGAKVETGSGNKGSDRSDPKGPKL
jgi:hypothetical protein